MDIERVVHAGASDGIDYTLCGLALEGEDGEGEMDGVRKRIDCPDCLRIIAYCKGISARFVQRPSLSRRSGE